MIRRKAAMVGTGAQGFSLGWLVKKADDGNESMTMIFEDKTTGVVTEKPVIDVKFSDGSPDVIVELE